LAKDEDDEGTRVIHHALSLAIGFTNPLISYMAGRRRPAPPEPGGDKSRRIRVCDEEWGFPRRIGFFVRRSGLLWED